MTREEEIERDIENCMADFGLFHWSFKSARDLPNDNLSRCILRLKEIAMRVT